MLEPALRIEPESNVAISRAHPVMRVGRANGPMTATRAIANEVPVAIEFDGAAYAVMMLTPADLEDFAIGFALSERIVSSAAEISRIDIRYGARGVAINILLREDASARVAERRRALPGQSGCGLCGITTIEEAMPELPAIGGAPRLAREAIFAATDALSSGQILNQRTGAVHAAAFCNSGGSILAMREDVGRHNAFDKVIGHLARRGIEAGGGFALLTSRCSFELVQKAILARIPALITVSAPTELAVALARKSQLTLCALARHDSFLVFHDPFNSIVN